MWASYASGHVPWSKLQAAFSIHPRLGRAPVTEPEPRQCCCMLCALLVCGGNGGGPLWPLESPSRGNGWRREEAGTVRVCGGDGSHPAPPMPPSTSAVCSLHAANAQEGNHQAQTPIGSTSLQKIEGASAEERSDTSQAPAVWTSWLIDRHDFSPSDWMIGTTAEGLRHEWSGP